MPDLYDDKISQLKTDEQLDHDLFIDAEFGDDSSLIKKTVEENPTNNALVHLSPLLTSFVTGLGFIGPVICWMIWKNAHPNTVKHIKESLNFTISMFILVLIMTPFFIGGFFTLVLAAEYQEPIFAMILGILGVVGLIGIIVLALMSLILPIVAAYKASRGGFFRYPLTKRFFK